ncbi:AAA family ATPase [Telmatocola sphagniphila]|uniref:AAA family ATPase n=1 Tax=Telmatocola sphagniphila TaxID=1123043 RepID=A0A8E6ES81_9BACT|nr:AAA family ATPase [Telmatocola sphagniphila]QVL30319.1 AAA family ATPase [Telmatocola sphagniphila]
MFLSIVEIENFRAIKSLRVDLGAGLNVVVGRNNTGKTAILDAIRHALGPSASRGESLWLDRDDFFKESVEDTEYRTISITLTFADLSAEQRSHFFEIVDFNVTNLANSKAVIKFTASWPKGKRQAQIRRTGGPVAPDTQDISTRILESLPVTYLPALRDAKASLTPGSRSRLALLLRDLAERRGGTVKTDIESIYSQANHELEKHDLIKGTITSLQSTTIELAGSDYSPSAIRAAEVEFERILRLLHIQMDGAPIGDLEANGLGYNNLLYIAVVLEHLREPVPDESPLLLIEEPEAHLHPQLTMLLAEYLSNKTPGSKTPQTIVTTHSPTLAASVQPCRISVLFADKMGSLHCNRIANSGMTPTEESDLQRMLDVTRATLYFAKAVILVEGISEALLLPPLAKRLGRDLAKLHISVIPICGVAFGTFKKLFDTKGFGIPVAIVSDSDPSVPTNVKWEEAVPEMKDGEFVPSARMVNLRLLFDKHTSVQVFSSALTLEYDLALAGNNNANVMADVWESCFEKKPTTFNKDRLAKAGNDLKDRALATWRGICRANHTGSKAEFAHKLAAKLTISSKCTACTLEFAVPPYLSRAIDFVVTGIDPPKDHSSGDSTQ